MRVSESTVLGWIMTGPSGAVLRTVNSCECEPNGVALTLSPWTTGRPCSNLPIYLPSGPFIRVRGVRTIFAAGLAAIFFTCIFSSIPAWAFSRTIPSICTSFLSLSSMKAGITLATVALLPAIWTMSPTSTPIDAMSLGSMRAIPLPTSLGSDSETLRLNPLSVTSTSPSLVSTSRVPCRLPVLLFAVR